MAYEYDVFLSYTTEHPFGTWVQETFLPLFKPYLKNAVNGNINIFFDRYGISSGDEWPEKIKRALLHSKCLVAMWSPSFFNSKWCNIECAIMLHREKKLGYRTIDNPSGLVIPVNVFDGDDFPAFAKRIQCLDCRNFVRVGEGFKKTERYVDFQDILITWVNSVANSIKKAPEWSAEWMNNEWFDEAIDNIPQAPSFIFKPPILEGVKLIWDK